MNLEEYETPLTDKLSAKLYTESPNGSISQRGAVIAGELSDFARDLERKLRMCREHIEAIEAASRVAFMATTCPIMTDTLAGIGKRCQEALVASKLNNSDEENPHV